ncbi:MAG: hypothetical protein ACT4QF_18815 [Sporichthyaceae bacterium]
MTDAMRHPGFTDEEAVIAMRADATAAVPYRPEQIFSDYGA